MKLIIVLLMSIFIFISCSHTPEPKKDNTRTEDIYEVTEHVWYIAKYADEFPKAYEEFLSKHIPYGLRVVAITGNGNAAYGRDAGYFIILEDKQ